MKHSCESGEKNGYESGEREREMAGNPVGAREGGRETDRERETECCKFVKGETSLSMVGEVPMTLGTETVVSSATLSVASPDGQAFSSCYREELLEHSAGTESGETGAAAM